MSKLICVSDRTTTYDTVYYSEEELKEAVKNDKFTIIEPIYGTKCKLAYSNNGWLTVVTENGGILQGWAGSFNWIY